MEARGIPASLTNWITAFCSDRTATIEINGRSSESHEPPQSGLPQDSPLSPVLFLFLDADLVQHPINKTSRSIAFVDNYAVWVAGPTAQANEAGIQTILIGARLGGSQWRYVRDGKDCRHPFQQEGGQSEQQPFPGQGQKGVSARQGQDTESQDGLSSAVQTACGTGVEQSTGNSHRAQKAEGSAPGHGPKAVHSHGGSHPGVRVERLEICLWRPVMHVVNRVQKVDAQAIVAFGKMATAVAEAEAHILPPRSRFAEVHQIMQEDAGHTPSLAGQRRCVLKTY